MLNNQNISEKMWARPCTRSDRMSEAFNKLLRTPFTTITKAVSMHYSVTTVK